MLEKESKYYLKHQNDLVKKYDGKWLLIKNENVIGSFESKEDVFNESQKAENIGKVLIQYCSLGEAAYTQTFHSRVYVR